MPTELVLTGPGRLEFVEYGDEPLVATEVRARALMSAISHGTEISLFRGTSPFHNKAFDPERRLFTEVAPDQAYPARLGYEWVGRVSEVGDSVRAYQPGDLVHLPSPHRQTSTFAPNEVLALGVSGPLPGSLAPEQAVFLATTSIALQAVQDARIKVGDHVVVFGLGVLGLMAVQLARLSGAHWIDAVDPIPSRRELAQSFGANRTLDPDESDTGLALKSNTEGADVAIEFSGSYAALHQAIRCVRMAGLVVAAGFYQGGGTELRLGEEWHHNRVSMVSSLRGWGNPHRDYPLWDRARVRGMAIALLSEGQLRVEELLTHKIRFERAQEAFELIDSGSPEVLKIAFEY